MKKILATFLQILILLFGASVAIVMLWEPHLEGRNVGATVFEIYFKDPFLACAYLASIAFFVALYKAFRLCDYAKHNNLSSSDSVKALEVIRYCALLLIGCVAIGEIYLFVAMRGKDDITGGIAMGIFTVLIFASVAVATTIFERKLQNKVNKNC